MKKNSIGIVSKIIIGLIFAILCMYVIILAALIVWGINSSLKSDLDFMYNLWGLPKKIMFSNYSTVWDNFYVDTADTAKNLFRIYMTMSIDKQGRFHLGMISYSILYSVVGGFLAAFVPCVVGYVLAKYPNKFSKFFYGLIMVLIIIPIVGGQAATIDLLVKLNLYDTIIGSWIMAANCLTLYLFVFEAFFSSMSDTYGEAAKIDGASDFMVFFRIYFPLARNTLFTIWLLMFIARWNDYSVPLLYIPSKVTLAYGVYWISQNAENVLASTPIKIAGSLVLVLPIMVIFLFLHKRIMGNISMGGIKE